LVARGARQFKFVDRTFNLNLKISSAILVFFLERIDRGLFLHFELVPDRLPIELRDVIRQFPAGSLQFEIGVQTFSPAVTARIRRRQDYRKLEDNFRFLRAETGVHIHADLIAGLPGEDEESFGRGFDQLLSLRPQEIQVGILKRLRGTPIVRHDVEWQMVYSKRPPYEILSTKHLSEADLKRLQHFAKFWDRFYNSGQFPKTRELFLKAAASQSVYRCFSRFTGFAGERFGRDYAIDLADFARALGEFLTGSLDVNPEIAWAAIAADYWDRGRRPLPDFLAGRRLPNEPANPLVSFIPARQRRHLRREKTL
jgi:radical SAM superfamily enzyme YgiQ (UPF0313 family)